jgi:hypothetical protein
MDVTEASTLRYWTRDAQEYLSHLQHGHDGAGRAGHPSYKGPPKAPLNGFKQKEKEKK